MIKSKFGKGFYFALTFLTILLAVVILLTAYAITHPHKSGDKILGATVFLILWSISFYWLFKSYRIKISGSDIWLTTLGKSTTISIDQIKLIYLLGQWNASEIDIDLTTPGKRPIRLGRLFSNIPEIKRILAKNFPGKIAPYKKEAKKNNSQDIGETDFIKFAGNPYTTFSAVSIYMFCGYAISIVLIIILQGFKWQLLIFLLIPVLSLIPASHLNYFLLSNKRLIAKNHLLSSVHKEFGVDFHSCFVEHCHKSL
ncbi:MAG: hypothetical protein ABI480_14100, partial [Chitinophagaceae bacterium]